MARGIPVHHVNTLGPTSDGDNTDSVPPSIPTSQNFSSTVDNVFRTSNAHTSTTMDPGEGLSPLPKTPINWEPLISTRCLLFKEHPPLPLVGSLDIARATLLPSSP